MDKKIKNPLIGSLISIVLYSIGVWISGVEMVRGVDAAFLYIFLILSAIVGSIVGNNT